MSDRYAASTYAPHLNLSGSGALGFTPMQARKPSAMEDFLRLAGGVAPALGTVAGGVIGGIAGGGIPGAALGASLGGAAGTGLGALATGGADQLARPGEDAQNQQLQQEQERQARARAAMSLLGGF